MRYHQSAAVIALLFTSVEAYWQRSPQPIGAFVQSPEDFIVKPTDAQPRKQWSEENSDMPAERVNILEPVIARTHTTFYDRKPTNQHVKFAQSPEDYIQKPTGPQPRKQWTDANPTMAEERVSILEPVIARTHTTFYAQNDEDVPQPEKVHVLEPEVYQNRANENKPNTRTTFYPQHHKAAFAQQDDVAEAPAEEAEEVVEMAAAEEQKEAAAAQAEAAPAESEGAVVANPPLPTEKVSIIEPMAYERRANYALPYMRSTFYDRKHHGASKHRVMFAQQDPVAMDGEAIAEGEAASKEKAVAQVVEADLAMKRKIGDPSEKTSILEPDAYENRSNYALPYMRTTYYGQTN